MFHCLDNSTRLVIQHEPRKIKKKVLLAFWENTFISFRRFLGRQKYSSYFSAKNFVLHLRLGEWQNCTDEFLEDVPKLAKKTKKNLRQNSSEKKPKCFGKNPKEPILVVALIRWHWYTIRSVWAQKIRKK